MAAVAVSPHAKAVPKNLVNMPFSFKIHRR